MPPVSVRPFCGYVDTTADALRLIQAARCGLIPRITRRLNELERRSMIKSGAIFVFSVDESGIKRWTDGGFAPRTHTVLPRPRSLTWMLFQAILGHPAEYPGTFL